MEGRGSEAARWGTAQADSSPDADLAEIPVEGPLQIISDDLGSDPYNHTGRFSVPRD
jgi:hypothetical protein